MMCYSDKSELEKVSKAGDEGKAALESEMQSQIDDIQGFAENGVGFKEEPNALKAAILAYFPQPTTCQPLEFTFLEVTKQMDCTLIEEFKMYIGWALTIYAAIYIWQMAIKPVER